MRTIPLQINFRFIWLLDVFVIQFKTNWQLAQYFQSDASATMFEVNFVLKRNPVQQFWSLDQRLLRSLILLYIMFSIPLSYEELQMFIKFKTPTQKRQCLSADNFIQLSLHLMWCCCTKPELEWMFGVLKVAMHQCTKCLLYTSILFALRSLSFCKLTLSDRYYRNNSHSFLLLSCF